ncbi:MAG: DNA primase [Candidatus Colwellbacteria bacterium RIFCSPLOWO2_01_FULL_48_10]|uniref:DNA primase n=2 Tax=Bacteria candidate phyla TaxID=1783234 RepID=A0A1F5P2J7_9BACT|nr:MAG: DNA primase [Candidatus Doudnabacteria bacterium RIFCSPHIGHO2_01_FULL_49_9]OGY60055.1 MAG: DNA primase [Candidatus Colwellbacteria bacterium RIFCSPLOWO2_01_FULL_48_10]
MQPSERIKEKINIVDFLRSYLEMRPAGRNFKANCPFHQEKTPSFIISPDRQIWHCFGCGLGGDVFKFLMTYENIEFYEALKILAEKAGVELKNLSSQDYRQFGVLYEINEVTKDFYYKQLVKSQNVKSYLSKRGLHEATIEDFEIGYAPNDFDATSTHLLKSGYKIDDILRAGIVFKTEQGKYGDRFRGRVMFPIHNHFGKIVGFTGRVLPEYDNPNMGKYINSPETQIFNKSKVMYGYWKTKQNIRENKTAVLVEGQMDFLMMWQSGIKNAAASSGTALTIEHLKVLKPIAETVVIAYDNDEAGKIATERALDLLGANDFKSAVVDLGSYKDPADAAADKDFLSVAVASAKPAMQYYFSRYLDGSTSDRKSAIRIILRKIARLYSQIDQSDFLRELSHSTGLSENDLRAEMEKVKADDETPRTAAPLAGQLVGASVSAKASRLELVALRVLGLLSVNDALRPLAVSHLGFMPENYRLAHIAMFGENADSQPDAETVLADPAIKQLIDFVSLGSGMVFLTTPANQEEEFKHLLRELELEHLKQKTDDLKNQIRIAESKGNEAMLTDKLREFDVVSRRMQDIRRNKSSEGKNNKFYGKKDQEN